MGYSKFCINICRVKGGIRGERMEASTTVLIQKGKKKKQGEDGEEK